MRSIHHLMSFLACLLMSAGTASAAGGGNAGGGDIPRGGGQTADLSRTFREGSQLLADGECKKAEKKFRKVLSAVAKNPEANYLRGAALRCQDKHKAAIRYFKKAKRYNEEMYAAYEMLGVSYLEVGDEEDARSELDELTERVSACGDECPPKLLRARSRLEAAIAGPEQAPDDVDSDSDLRSDSGIRERHGLLFDPTGDPQALYLSAVRLIHSERYVEAIEELHRFTATLGPHPDVLNYLGYAHRRLGLFETAQGYYEQALSIDPNHLGANEYLGEMWVELGRIDDARAHLAILDRLCPFGCAEHEDLRQIIGSRVAPSD